MQESIGLDCQDKEAPSNLLRHFSTASFGSPLSLLPTLHSSIPFLPHFPSLNQQPQTPDKYRSQYLIKQQISRSQSKMFEARLQECSIFRKIIDSLKELVKMVNIQVNSKGLSIQAMDSCHVALVSLLLKETAFTHYTCHKPLTLGLTIQNVSKILKLAGGEDSMILQCQDEPTSLKFRFESKRGEKISEFNLSLMNLDSESLGIPETEFSSVCTMPSNEFNRICREFGGLSETIKIETNKECIKFSIAGEIGTGNAVLNQRESGDDNTAVTLEVDEPVSLSFAARYLNLFSKAAGLSSQVTLNMSNETPLMVEFKLSNNAGELKYYLAPKITEEE